MVDLNHFDGLNTLRIPEALRFECEVIQVSKQNSNTIQLALHPQLAQLEMLVNPTVETLLSDHAMANAGSLEIIPLEQPLTLFVWSDDAHQEPTVSAR